MYSETHAGYVVIIHWCIRRLQIFINAHVYIWARKLGDIEEEVCPILSRMPGRLLLISRGIWRTIVLAKSLYIRTMTCGCGGLQKLVGVKC